MFENILGQPVIDRLVSDITGGVLAPSMLFSGPPGSGKGSAVLELGRILSCENTGSIAAPWNCSCSACSRHRQLVHPDLLLLGSRPFSAEAAASAAAFLRAPSNLAARILFIRSIRKLLARFSPVLWEDDPKIGKLNAFIQALDEELEELDAADPEADTGGTATAALQKIVAAILKNTFKLDAEGVGELIPVAQIRRAAYWSRLAPQGKRKLLVIENADHMQDGARNSLLKILEEPPATVTIVLTTARHEGLLPTILSRLRPYRFSRREPEVETEVIRRIFQDTPDARFSAPVKDGGQGGLIGIYLDSFLPISGEILYPLGALFVTSVTREAALDLKRSGAPLSEALVALGKYTASIAEAAGMGRPFQDTAPLVSKVLSGADNFEIRSRFTRFLTFLLTLVGEGLKSAPPDPACAAWRDIWCVQVREAEAAVGTYNLNPALALDRLASNLRRAMVSHGFPQTIR